MKKLIYGKEIIKSFGVGEEKHRVLNGVSVKRVYEITKTMQNIGI